MTSLEWKTVRKRLAQREHAMTKALAGMDGPIETPEGESMKLTPRGMLVFEIKELQATRKSLKFSVR